MAKSQTRHAYIQDYTGHTTVAWDLDASAAIAAAEEIVNAKIKAGSHIAIRERDGATIPAFDPQEDITLVRQLQGG